MEAARVRERAHRYLLGSGILVLLGLSLIVSGAASGLAVVPVAVLVSIHSTSRRAVHGRTEGHMIGGRDRREPEGPEPHGEGNGYVESFNGRLRDELLNRELFLSVPEARYVLDEWREDYNQRRPHGSLDWQTPAAYAGSLADQHQPILS